MPLVAGGINPVVYERCQRALVRVNGPGDFDVHDPGRIRGGRVLYRFRWFVIAFLMVLALAPFSGLVAAALLALAVGCKINDAAPEPCAVYGWDAGPLLSNLTLTASLGEVVFLILVVTFSAWAIAEGLGMLVRWGRSSRERL
jgi:hypothetical protein